MPCECRPLLAHTHHAAWHLHYGQCQDGRTLARVSSPLPPHPRARYREGKWRGKWRIARLDEPAFPSRAHYKHTTHTQTPPPSYRALAHSTPIRIWNTRTGARGVARTDTARDPHAPFVVLASPSWRVLWSCGSPDSTTRPSRAEPTCTLRSIDFQPNGELTFRKRAS